MGKTLKYSPTSTRPDFDTLIHEPGVADILRKFSEKRATGIVRRKYSKDLQAYFLQPDHAILDVVNHVIMVRLRKYYQNGWVTDVTREDDDRSAESVLKEKFMGPLFDRHTGQLTETPGESHITSLTKSVLNNHMKKHVRRTEKEVMPYVDEIENEPLSNSTRETGEQEETFEMSEDRSAPLRQALMEFHQEHKASILACERGCFARYIALVEVANALFDLFYTEEVAALDVYLSEQYKDFERHLVWNGQGRDGVIEINQSASRQALNAAFNLDVKHTTLDTQRKQYIDNIRDRAITLAR